MNDVLLCFILHFFFSEGKGDGVFLVRDSNTSPGDYVLSVLHSVSDAVFDYSYLLPN